ncbi:MAG: hypothetical protein U1E78_11295 [Gammaproteobacteria bacterium]
MTKHITIPFLFDVIRLGDRDMFELTESQLIEIYGGALSMRGDTFTVTDGSVINFGGLKFTVTGLCQNDICSDDVFNTPTEYTLKNPDRVVLISGEFIENGAVYNLSAAPC